ncbi:MAG: hypothetical protein HOK30_15155 [Rhodospirillaceae bacterium]|jgi:hypothetical protein|nr:hypothetical protein [Rhodospirillaceae bacterium]MBT5191627.1 hypothetical protein [Rhodospirillaceae bacterium]MBT5896704.1 hypothetical protein [Rhodospirillaceae bacterium]MBT6429004.1 hypothetical protein [Rhodospirillaceae bacterium]
MAGSDSGNAMTEIALALAMAFFAIMILTMVSMGGQGGQPKGSAAAKTMSDPMRLAAPADQKAAAEDAEESQQDTRVVQPRQLIIFSSGRFLDDKLQTFNPADMTAMTRPVLAVSPDLSLAEVMAAKNRLALPNVTVTILNRHWLDAIKEHEK